MKKFSLRAARTQAGLGRTETAEKLGVGSDSIWRWETGRQSPPADVAEKICRLYGMSFEDIDWNKKGEQPSG